MIFNLKNWIVFIKLSYQHVKQSVFYEKKLPFWNRILFREEWIQNFKKSWRWHFERLLFPLRACHLQCTQLNLSEFICRRPLSTLNLKSPHVAISYGAIKNSSLHSVKSEQKICSLRIERFKRVIWCADMEKNQWHTMSIFEFSPL